ncbi:VOC family protein [Sphingomonas abietis]|uniref:VOC family protein n=1 Tax=Sphingomonas abietis TaxID=3012344 RepID=A0ABY7NWG8_9SPHN|nr:VOC family protein [Sphingomonas abietis]WBO23766.1 VOC family protein [Sphingomonas abietis]
MRDGEHCASFPRVSQAGDAALAGSEGMLTVDAIDHLVLHVRDVDVSAAWYAQMLGMVREDRPAASGDIRTSMMFGQNKINLRPLTATQKDWFTGRMPCPGSDDLCFLTEASPDDVAAHFREQGAQIILGPVIKSGARGPICSVYVRDPDGNLVEVSSYRA